MPVELTIVESVTELDTTVVEVILESASAPGPAGPGVAPGGTVGQVLTKQSGTDFDTDWEDPTGGGGVTDADYLVGTAHGGLSAEIVVGKSRDLHTCRLATNYVAEACELSTVHILLDQICKSPKFKTLQSTIVPGN